MSKTFHKKKADDGDGEDWMCTYADAITLLLCFFVVLISVSEPKKAQFKKVQEAFVGENIYEKEDPYEMMVDAVESLILESGMGESMSVEETDDGLIIDIASNSFYKTGSADFKPEAIPVLLDLSVIIKDFDYEDYMVEVEGHTDDTPMSGNGIFPTNWELSAARATGVVRFFIEETITKERLRAKAFADTQPKVPNIDKHGNGIEANRELNRRIAIRVERQE